LFKIPVRADVWGIDVTVSGVGVGIGELAGAGVGKLFVTTTTFGGVGVGIGIGVPVPTTRGRIEAGEGVGSCPKNVRTELKMAADRQITFVFINQSLKRWRFFGRGLIILDNTLRKISAFLKIGLKGKKLSSFLRFNYRS
jgi:hypothetical protein